MFFMGYLKALNLLPIEYSLQSYHRSNQDTTLVHKPLVKEGDWVQSGDLISDCSASIQGEFSIGHNILIAYLPWEGYNYEDAILISERLVYDDLYTSVHIEKYDVSIEKTPYGDEQITKNIALLKETNELNHLDKNGIAQLGSWLKEGDILVGKITPLESKKEVARYVQLYNEILGKTIDYSVRDTSLRVPRGLEAKVIKIQTFPSDYGVNKNFSLIKNGFQLKSSFKNLKLRNFFSQAIKKSKFMKSQLKKSLFVKKGWGLPNLDVIPGKFLQKFNKPNADCLNFKLKLFKSRRNLLNQRTFRSSDPKYLVYSTFAFESKFSKKRQFCLLYNSKKKIKHFTNLKRLSAQSLSARSRDKIKFKFAKMKRKVKLKSNLKKQSSVITAVNIYLAEKRKVQVGDKMAGRHGNKGIISQILPRQDMPYLPDGTPIDMALNPLGVPSRMNVGQIFECLLGLAGKHLGEQYRIKPFDESYGPEASRSFVFSKLYEAKRKTGQSWIFQPTNPGKLKLYDGRTGDCFDQPMTSGYSYMIKLVHLVDDKLHSRSTGPYSLITQQPLKGRSKHGGQRLGEMEVWAIEAYGAAFTLLELLTIKSDDVTGRLTIWDYILYKKPLYIGTPASFKVMVCELQALCLDIGIYKADHSNLLKQINISTMG
uniref:DNA-directed RNA polymerase n=1 Tax=Uronema sp. FACHB-2429 TaxID=2725787 RepID=A0A6H1U658_9CHLO|nr:beta subunit of RNA polymerase [Uronema sp. FACHB-2429]